MCRLNELVACSHKSAHERQIAFLNVVVLFSFGQKQTWAELSVTEQPFLGRTLLTHTKGGC